MQKVLITDDVHPRLIHGLEELGYSTDYRPEISLPSCADIIKEYSGVIINSKIKADRDFLEKATQLTFIARLGSGLEIIDLQAAESQGIEVINSPEGNANAVGEHALGMLLALANHIPRADREVKSWDWNREKNRGMELAGKRIGIIGYGHTGTAFVSKLSSMDMEIWVYDKYKTHLQSNGTFTVISYDDLFACDILSFHLPLTPETYHYCDRKFLTQCKKPVIIVNTSRGTVINTRDLLDALTEKRVVGACLDVFENEKVRTFTTAERALYERLYELDNVVLTPHVAGWTHESKERIADVLVNKIGKWRQNLMV